MNQNIYINEIPSAELTIYDNGTPVTVVIANGAVSQNKVPYTGATQNVNLGEYGISAGFVQLDTTPTTYTPAVGNMGWNDSEGTIDLLLKGGAVSLPLGQKQVARIVNGTGGNVLKSNYQVVKVTGAQGQRLQVNLAQANNDANSADTLGLIAENINNNNSGFIITSGLVENINTTGSLQSETWTDGNILYLSPTTPGAITNVKPQAPNHTVIVGFVVYAHANNGKIFVKVDNGYELDELHNVLINTGTLANGQVLKYNSSIQVWENNSDAGITGSGTSGQVAYWNGTTTQTGSNNLFWDNANGRLGIGTNAPGNTLHLSASNTSNSQVRIGTLEIQNFSLNNSWFGDNVYFNGTNFIARQTGFTGMFYFFNNEGQFRLTNSVSAGTGVGTGNTVQLKINSDGTFAVGSAMTSTASNYTNAKLLFFGSTGNLALNSTTDSGQRLQVTGDTLLKGSGNTFATFALTIQNSDGSNLLRVRNHGSLSLGNQASTSPIIFPYATVFGGPSLSGTNLGFYSYTTSEASNNGVFNFGTTNLTNTTTTLFFIKTTTGFAPTSGTNTFTILGLEATINQTGGANGITRGLYVNPTLTAAADWRSIEWSNNTGWGLYGAGTAPNYVAGNLLIGSTNNFSKLYVGGNTGASNITYALAQPVLNGSFTDLYSFRSSIVPSGTVTLTNSYHYGAFQSAIGTTTINNQYGYFVDSSLTGATNNFGFYGNIASGTGRWNLYMNGTADNYLAGRLGIGSTSLTDNNLVIGRSITGSSQAGSVVVNGTIQSDVTGFSFLYATYPSVVNQTFTLSNLYHYGAVFNTKGASATITNQYGFWADQSLTTATNNFGFYGNIASGTGRWNLYMNGTAANYLSGNLALGATTYSSYKLSVVGSEAYFHQGVRIGSGYSLIDVVTGTSALYLSGSQGALNHQIIYSSGNVNIGGGADAGFKLDVNGTARIQSDTTIKGSGTTSATTALTIQNSSNSTYLQVRNDGSVIGNTAGTSVSAIWGLAQYVAFQGRTLALSGSAGGGTDFLINSFIYSSTSTFSGTANFNRFNNSFTHSANANIVGNIVIIDPTINQTGGANGITRGLYINPTLTAAADWRSIETSNNTGYALYLGGSADAFFNDATDFQFGTTTGTKIGTATSQKLGFWNATPIVQPTTGVASATRVGGGGTTLTDTDTFDGYTLAQIVKALRNTGILA